MRSTGSIPICSGCTHRAGARHLGRSRGRKRLRRQWSQFFDDPELFLRRRAAAYQAFYEHMPVRPILSRPDGPAMRIYDRFTFGDLLKFR